MTICNGISRHWLAGSWAGRICKFPTKPMTFQSGQGSSFTHHELERRQLPPRTLHEQMMLEAEPIIQHNWTDVAIHDAAKLCSIPSGHVAYWIVGQMGSYLTPAYCSLADRPLWTSGRFASLAPIQLLVARWHGEVHKFRSSDAWSRVHGPISDKRCYIIIKGDSVGGQLIPISYKELADLAVCKTRPMVIEQNA